MNLRTWFQSGSSPARRDGERAEVGAFGSTVEGARERRIGNEDEVVVLTFSVGPVDGFDLTESHDEGHQGPANSRFE